MSFERPKKLEERDFILNPVKDFIRAVIGTETRNFLPDFAVKVKLTSNENIRVGMVWYGMVTLFKHGISFRYTFIEKTNFLTSLKTKIKEIKLIKMKRKHLLFKEAVCKNRISLVKLFINQNLCLLIFP